MGFRALLLATLVGSGLGTAAETSFGQSDDDPPHDSSRWEEAIARFEQLDAQTTPRPAGVLFLGSSSIRQWRLDESFPDRGYVNRGFGGSQLADAIAFFDRIVVPHEPRVIVLYAGDNDLAEGKSVERVVADFGTFAARVREKLPRTHVLFIAIKPSLARWKLIDAVRAANAGIRQACEGDDRLGFVEIEDRMIGDDGRPRPELFAEDGLHLSEAGYAIWTERVAEALRRTDVDAGRRE